MDQPNQVMARNHESENNADHSNAHKSVRRSGRTGTPPSSLRRRAWSPKEVAEQLGVPYETVLDLIHAEKIGTTKAGRYYLIPDFELERFLGTAQKSA
jgi:excisionase family DNA binding protein